MNFGKNILNFVQSNVQSLVLAAIVCLGVYFFVEKKTSKLATLIIVAVIAIGFTFATTDVKDLLLKMFNTFFK